MIYYHVFEGLEPGIRLLSEREFFTIAEARNWAYEQRERGLCKEFFIVKYDDEQSDVRPKVVYETIEDSNVVEDRS